MDRSRFDQIARLLAATGIQRRALAGLLGGALLPLLPDEESEAKKNRGRSRRNERQKRRDHDLGSEKKKKKKKKKKPPVPVTPPVPPPPPPPQPGCTADPKATTCGIKCGPVVNNCGTTVDCGSCACPTACGTCKICVTGPNTPGVCVIDEGADCGEGRVCQVDGACACNATSCSNPTPICSEGQCEACDTNEQCGANKICCDGSCHTGTCCNDSECTDLNQPICSGNVCGACTRSSECLVGQICGDGPCLDCDVCADGCDFDSVQAAINAAAQGDTVAICPGAYENEKGRVVLSSDDPERMVTLIGAGNGDEPEFDTILKNTQPDNRVVHNAAKLKLQNLRITGGASNFGAGISSWGELTVVRCTIIENVASGGGGGVSNAGTMQMFDSTVRKNDAENGGGISTDGGSTSTFSNCDITENDATSAGGGIYSAGTVTFQAPTSRVTGNIAAFSGGGIYGDGDGAVLNGIAFANISGNDPESSQCGGRFECPT